MPSSNEPESVPDATRFAEGDLSEGNDLKQRITDSFSERFPNVKSVHVSVFGKTAALRGEVRSVEEKFQCVEYCRHVAGVVRIVDDLTALEQGPIHLDPDDV